MSVFPTKILVATVASKRGASEAQRRRGRRIRTTPAANTRIPAKAIMMAESPPTTKTPIAMSAKPTTDTTTPRTYSLTPLLPEQPSKDPLAPRLQAPPAAARPPPSQDITISTYLAKTNANHDNKSPILPRCARPGRG